jgi:CBS domain containing-hemolysin-like protein
MENSHKENDEPPHLSLFQRIFKKIFKNNSQKDKDLLTKEFLEIIDQNNDFFLNKNQINKNLKDKINIIKDVVSFYKLIIDDIKITRNKIIGLAEKDIYNIFNIFKEHNISNIMIYKENIDQIIGFINTKDLLRFNIDYNNNKTIDKFLELKKLIRKPLFVPPTMKISNLLLIMKNNLNNVGVVVDEHGGTDGLVFLSDIISEMTGQINQNLFINFSSYEEFEVNPLISIDILESKIGEIDLIEYNDVETLNGLLISIKNKIPKVNTEVKLNNNFSCKILDHDERMIKKILIKKNI